MTTAVFQAAIKQVKSKLALTRRFLLSDCRGETDVTSAGGICDAFYRPSTVAMGGVKSECTRGHRSVVSACAKFVGELIRATARCRFI